MAGETQPRIWTAVAVLVVTALVFLSGAIVLGLAVPGVSSPVDQTTETQAHQEPSTVTGEEDLGPLERQLASTVQQQVETGALNLTREDYEQAQEQLGDENYQQLVESYGDVATEVGTAEQQQLFQQAQRAQQNYTELTAAYWEGLDAYEQFENATLAEKQRHVFRHRSFDNAATLRRDMARDLEETTAQLTETGDRTIELYEELETMTDEDYSAIISSINDSQATIQNEQADVRAEQFVPTNLTLSTPETTQISPVDPLEVEGRLTDADGTPLSNQTVQIDVGEQRHNVTVNEAGEFEFDYHPTLIAANSTAVTVTYVPAAESIYLGDSMQQNVTVEQATPTVSLDATPDEAAYNSTVAVRGDVSAGDRSVADAPFVLEVQDQFLVQNTTSANGTIRENVSVPAAVEAGDQELTASLLLDNQTLQPTNQTTALTIRESETTLAVDAEPTAEETILVSGTAATVDGDPVVDQQLTISVEGTAVSTTRADERGAFRQQIVVPDSVADEIDEDELVQIEVSFDGTGSSLTTASTATTTQAPAGSGGFGVSWWLLVPVAVVLVVGLAYLLVTRDTRQLPRERGGQEPTSDLPDQQTTTVSYLDHAVELLEEDRPAQAVQAGYAAIRQQLTETDSPRTHWELYHDHRSTLDEDTERALRAATEGYEQAAFAPEAVDQSTAHTVLDAVETLTERQKQRVRNS